MAEAQKVMRYLRAVPAAPSDPAQYADWVRGKDALEFFHQFSGEAVPVYINGLDAVRGLHFFVHGVFAPRKRFVGEYWTDLLEWSFGVSSGWSYGSRMVGARRIQQPTIFPPLAGC